MTTPPNQSNEILQAVQFHPLFQGVDTLSLVEECELRSYAKSEMLLQADTPRQGLLLVLQGIAEVFVKNGSGDEEVLEVIQQDEIIGLSSLAEFLGFSVPEKHTVEVRAVENVSALLIPFAVLEKRWHDQHVHDYLLAQIAIRLRDVYGSLAEQMEQAKGVGETILARVQDLMSTDLVSVTPETTIQEAARKMAGKQTSSVLVIAGSELKGIITERDIVGRVVATGLSYQAESSTIMTANPLTISRFSYYYDAFSDILLNGIKHLPVVDDGQISGIITLTDLHRKKNDSVMKTIKKIQQADRTNLPQIKDAIYEITESLLTDRVPIFALLDIVTKLYDRLITRTVELAVEALGEAPVPFAFYLMGSSGRAEQIMLTDQDHFLVYAETTDHSYFEKLGHEITNLLEHAGYARCQGLMMASERQWRGTVQQWQDRVRNWMLQSTNDHLLLAQNFFSWRFAAGSAKVNAEFESKIAELLQRSKIFLYRMAKAEHEIPTLSEPIRALFKMDRKSIDLKKEILFPFHHSLQILALYHGCLKGTPLGKLAFLTEKGVITTAFSAELRAAFSDVLDVYLRQRWVTKAGSSVLTFSQIPTRQKDELILSLRSMRELQAQVFARFSL